MISILIPVYNQDVHILVARLCAGLSRLEGGGEIIVMDDGSAPAYNLRNADLAALPGVRLVVQPANQGRLKIRQLLAQEAKGEWLLFLDGDSGIPDEDFLPRYAAALQPGTAVVVGGRTYQTHPPANSQLRLHWKYGTNRENRQPGRQHQPAFMTNNFLIAARLFRTLQLGQPTQGYGHEDTWIGIQLEEAAIQVDYIDNPVIHEGLEETAEFIRKSENALVNLKQLSRQVPAGQLARHVKLFRVYRQLQKWRLHWAPLWGYKLFENRILRNLHSDDPSLRLFDLYRLYYFSRL